MPPKWNGLLIGADGSHSVVRKLIELDTKLVETGWVIYGKTPLTPETMQWLPESWVNGFSLVVGPDGVGMGTGLSRVGFSCSRFGSWRSALVLPLLFLALAFVF